MLKLIPILLLSFTMYGCISGNKAEIPENIRKLKNLTVIPATAQPTYQVSFKQDAVYGESKNVLIGDIVRIAVDEAGNVYILDGRDIKIFNPDGHYVTHFGGEGKGPGEFVSLPFLSIVSDRLYAHDILGRVNVFSTDSLALIRTINLKAADKEIQKSLPGFMLRRAIPRSDGLFLGKFIPARYPRHPGYDPDKLVQQYYLINDQGKIISKCILRLPGLGLFNVGYLVTNKGTGFYPFIPNSLMRVSDAGQIYTAWSKEFLIRIHTPEGDYLRAFYHPHERAVLNPDSALFGERDNAYNRRIIRNADLPETWPALNEMLIDDENRLWVSTIVEDFGVYEWWVLKNTGELIAKFKWPQKREIKEIKNGYAYTLERDEQTGLQKVVRYRIEMEEI